VNEKVENTIDNYSNLLFRKPGTVLIIAVIFTAIVASGASNVETVEQNQEDLLPDSLPTMQAFSTISAEFSSDSGTTYTVLVEANPQYSNSNEIRDLTWNPEAIRFMRAVSNDIESVDRVSSVSSGSDLFQDIPSDKQGVQNVFNRLGEPRWQNYISEDYQNGLVRVNTVDLTAEEQMEMADTIRTTVEAHEKPSGLDVGYTGQPYIDEAFQNQTNQTMSLTGIAALLGVIIVVVVLFRSFFLWCYIAYNIDIRCSNRIWAVWLAGIKHESGNFRSYNDGYRSCNRFWHTADRTLYRGKTATGN